jgi:SAM-dependent methyltransferase
MTGLDPARRQVALRLLGLCCPPAATVADLGCLHGAYSVAFARAGYQVTGIDARPENIEQCEERKAAEPLPGLRFVQDDARNLASYGLFDAVFCCGLLYHLDEPVKFLAMLGQVTARLLIVQTHFARTASAVNEGYEGIWAEEQDNSWSAWGNPRSFWLTKPDLLAAMQDAGFDLVLECRDHINDINGAPSRGMFAAVKDSGYRGR